MESSHIWYLNLKVPTQESWAEIALHKEVVNFGKMRLNKFPAGNYMFKVNYGNARTS